MEDIVARSEALDREIEMLAISSDRVFTKRAVVAGFLVVVAVMCLGFTAMFLRMNAVTTSTNRAVTREIPGLERQIERRDETIDDLEDVNGQAVDAILDLARRLRDAGLEPPEIVLRPSDEGG